MSQASRGLLVSEIPALRGAHDYADMSRRVQASPVCSNWLKQALAALERRDPVDAAADADILAALMRRRCDESLERV